MDQKFIIIGSHWINVNMILWADVEDSTSDIGVDIYFSGSAPGNPMGLSLHGQEAETFIKQIKEYTKAS